MLLNDHIFLSHRSGRDCFLRCCTCCSASWWCKQLTDARACHLFIYRIIISVFLLLYFRQSITPWPIILVVCVWSSIMKTSHVQTSRREQGRWRMKVGLSTVVNQSASVVRVVTFLCDAESLRTVFSKLGFRMKVHKDLTAEAIRCELQSLAKRNFVNEDALVRDRKHLFTFGILKNVFSHVGKKCSVHIWWYEAHIFTIVFFFTKWFIDSNLALM